MKRSAQPALSYEGQRALDQYAHALQQVEDLTAVTIRNYPSDLRQFIAWCEAVREVSLNATARSLLCMYLEALPKERIYLFHSGKTQEALTEHALGHLITTYARQAHLVDISPRALRHRFGYRMAEGVPLHWLAQIMGHDSQYDVEKIAWTSQSWADHASMQEAQRWLIF
jgi:site-specific recombinase XerD